MTISQLPSLHTANTDPVGIGNPYLVYVVGGGMEYLRMFYEAGFRGATSVQDADIICFTGGEDVTPSLYGEHALRSTFFNTSRDEREQKIFEIGKALKTPMVGICRGGQFLNVMNGGKMWQHVDNHANGKGHELLDVETNKSWHVTSTHHQMMLPAAHASVIALACEATEKHAADLSETGEATLEDVEVLWYEDTSCLCFQPHPEFSHDTTRQYFLELMDRYIMALWSDEEDEISVQKGGNC